MKSLILSRFIVFTLLFVSISAYAELRWDIAAYVCTGAALVVTVASMGTALTPMALAATASVGLHVCGAGFYWDDINPPTTSSGQEATKAISVIIDPDQPLVTPQGWTQGTTESDYEPQPPAAANNTQMQWRHYDPEGCTGEMGSDGYCYFNGVDLPVLVANIESYALQRCQTRDYPPEGHITGVRAISATLQGDPFQSHYGRVKCTQEYYGGVGDPSYDTRDYGSIYRSPTCPSGYATESRDIKQYDCQLTNAEYVQKPADEQCEIRVKVGEFVKAKNDPDCNVTTVTGIGTSNLAAVTPNNSIYMVASPTGDVSLYEKIYHPDIDRTVTNIVNFGHQSDVNYLQTVHALGNQVAVNPAVIDPSNGSGGGGSGSTDTEGLASNNKLDEIFNSTSEIDDKSYDVTTALTDPFGNFFDPLTNITTPANTATCPTWDFTIDFELMGAQWYSEHNIDSHCELIEDNKTILEAAFTLSWVLAALGIVLRA